MVSKKHLAVLLAAASLAAATSVKAESYTITFNDLTYNDANGTYGQVLPAGYQPSELAGSGISITSWGTAPLPYYGHNLYVDWTQTLGFNDATYARTGSGSGADLTTDYITFNTPVYITNIALSSYMTPAVDETGTVVADETPENIARGRLFTLSGYTNASDTTPAITALVALPLHGESWRAIMVWRNSIDLQDTPITKLSFSAPGFAHIDDITVSTTSGTNNPGDFNGDGIVDDADYTTWADTYDIWADPAFAGKAWDSASTWGIWAHGVNLAADANENGFVDDGDYTAWADNYGYGVAAAAVVPEPASLGLLAIGGSLLLRRRK